MSADEVTGTLLHETRHETISTHLSHSNTYQYRQNYKKNLNFFRGRVTVHLLYVFFR